MLDAVSTAYDLLAGKVVGPWARDAAGLLGEVEGRRVLDLCTGTGLMARELVRRKALVTGVDRSRRMLERARKQCPQAEFLLMDVRDMHFPAAFEAASISLGLHALPPPGAVTVLKRLQAFCPGPLLVLDWAHRPAHWLSRWLLELAERAEGSYYREYMAWGAERIFADAGWRVKELQQLHRLVNAWLLEW
jgi:ubiquinone/menaquinone biosynthesis C-methylase UbiE